MTYTSKRGFVREVLRTLLDAQTSVVLLKAMKFEVEENGDPNCYVWVPRDRREYVDEDGKHHEGMIMFHVYANYEVTEAEAVEGALDELGDAIEADLMEALDAQPAVSEAMIKGRRVQLSEITALEPVHFVTEDLRSGGLDIVGYARYTEE